MYLFHSLGIASSQVSVSVSCLVMPYCLQPHGLQPTSLLCPGDFSRQGYWSGLPFPSPGDLPNPGIEPRSPALQADSLPTELQGKPSDCANTSDNRTNYCTMLIFLFFKKAFIYLLSLWFFFFYNMSIKWLAHLFFKWSINPTPIPPNILPKVHCLSVPMEMSSSLDLLLSCHLGTILDLQSKSPISLSCDFLLGLLLHFSHGICSSSSPRMGSEGKTYSTFFFFPTLSFERVWPSVKF